MSRSKAVEKKEPNKRWISIDGEWVDANDLSLERRNQIFEELNIRAMKAAGFRPVIEEPASKEECNTVATM